MNISGEKIKNIRLCKKMSRAELSRKSGVPIRTLEDWEAGRRKPTNVDSVIQVAQSLQVDLSELYTEDYIELSALNAQALSDMDFYSDNNREEQALISKINNIYILQGDVGLAKLIDKFIAQTGTDVALKIVEDYFNESSFD